MAQSCDVLIVGGGVIGASIAYALARRRAGKVVLLDEKSFLGAGQAASQAPLSGSTTRTWSVYPHATGTKAAKNPAGQTGKQPGRVTTVETHPRLAGPQARVKRPHAIRTREPAEAARLAVAVREQAGTGLAFC